jgi:pyruvate formate lyase activating enzyme
MSLVTERLPSRAHRATARMEALRTGEIGSVHSWDHTTETDGPGTRLVLRMSGCPLRCQYCFGPDARLLRDGSMHTLQATLARIERDAPLISAPGGLTVSGGEPLLQPAFVGQVLRGAHQLGLHTALDTSGYLGRRADEDMLDDTDLVILDVKSGLPEVYRQVTGRDLAPTVEFGRRVARRGIPIWARFVVVPGLTDAWDNVEAVGEHMADMGVERVEVRGFEQAGRGVWHALGLDYRLEMTSEPDEELMARVRAQLRAGGLPVV